MANKHRSRVDVKQLVKTHGLIMASKTEQIRVAIFVDVCAPERLVGRVRKLFEPLKEQALLHVESFGSTAPIAPENTDLVVIVAGSSTLSSEIYDHARAKEIAVVVVCANMHEVVRAASTAGHPIPLLDIISYQYDDPTLINPERRFADALGGWIAYECREKRLSFARCFEFVRRPVSHEIIKATAIQNGAVGAVMFIPGADLPVMTLNQFKMVLEIAAAYDMPLSPQRLQELAVVLGGGFGMRTIARSLVGAIPALGWAIKAGVGSSGTVAMGLAAMDYFEKGAKLPNILSQAGAQLRKGADKASLTERISQVTKVLPSDR